MADPAMAIERRRREPAFVAALAALVLAVVTSPGGGERLEILLPREVP
jgi:hypothetical protein